MKHLGIRAHDLGVFASGEALAAEAARLGPSIPIQLAFTKVIAPAPHLTDEYVAAFAQALNAHGVWTAVLGCYINPVHPDEAIRDQQLGLFEEHLRLAPLLGNPIVGTETGSPNPDCSFHRETYEPHMLSALYRSIERLLEAAVRHNSTIGIEAVARQHTIGSIERMKNLVDHFDTPHLKVIYDPVNLVPWTGISEADGTVRLKPSDEGQAAFFADALDAFGSKIAALHIKDYRLDEQGWKVGDLPTGTGVLNWKLLFTMLSERAIDAVGLLENAEPQTMAKTLATLAAY
ncbi:MAG: sugar phosphate isomerase/epimerase family protein [Sphaerochaeta sp.]|jgi:sugar phosphate isomerase/epimerase|nr:sugar phosphate isomerase/epimerase [Sphaerochaeta sp.]MDX9914927.1 sugar phosphate isomerase/epimerase family protein [Sphaerochaeta sp.]